MFLHQNRFKPGGASAGAATTTILIPRVVIFLILFLVNELHCMDNLRVAFEWKQIDFNYGSDSDRRNALERKEFVPENNLPLGLEVYGERLFITVPRWKSGVAASLTYINLTGLCASWPVLFCNKILIQFVDVYMYM